MSNAPPTSLSLSRRAVTEGPAGTVVGRLSAIDPEGGPITFSLSGPDAEFFDIIKGRLVTRLPLDFEVAPLRSITLRATDADGLFTEQAVTIRVRDAAEPPLAINDEVTWTAQTPVAPNGISGQPGLAGTGQAGGHGTAGGDGAFPVWPISHGPGLLQGGASADVVMQRWYANGTQGGEGSWGGSGGSAGLLGGGGDANSSWTTWGAGGAGGDAGDGGNGGWVLLELRDVAFALGGGGDLLRIQMHAAGGSGGNGTLPTLRLVGGDGGDPRFSQTTIDYRSDPNRSSIDTGGRGGDGGAGSDGARAILATPLCAT